MLFFYYYLASLALFHNSSAVILSIRFYNVLRTFPQKNPIFPHVSEQ